MTRPLLVAILITFIVSTSQAQIRKGSLLLGGSLSLNKSETTRGTLEKKANTVFINPSFGIAIKDNWIIGISAGYSSYKVRPTTITFKNESQDFSAGIFGRYYHSISRSFYFYGQADATYYKSEAEQISGTDHITKDNLKGIKVSVTPGVSYAVSKRFHLETSLNNLLAFNLSKGESEQITLAGSTKTENKNTGFHTNFNTQAPFTIGFRLVIGK